MIFITDTGGGNALNVQRTVRDIIGTGAAGLFLEVPLRPRPDLHKMIIATPML